MGRPSSNSSQVRTGEWGSNRFSSIVGSWLLSFGSSRWLALCCHNCFVVFLIIDLNCHSWRFIFLNSFCFGSFILPLWATTRTNSCTLKFSGYMRRSFRMFMNRKVHFISTLCWENIFFKQYWWIRTVQASFWHNSACQKKPSVRFNSVYNRRKESLDTTSFYNLQQNQYSCLYFSIQLIKLSSCSYLSCVVQEVMIITNNNEKVQLMRSIFKMKGKEEDTWANITDRKIINCPHYSKET